MKFLYKSFFKKLSDVPSIFVFVILKRYQKHALRKNLTLSNRLLFFIKKVNDYKQPKTARQEIFLGRGFKKRRRNVRNSAENHHF